MKKVIEKVYNELAEDGYNLEELEQENFYLYLDYSISELTELLTPELQIYNFIKYLFLESLVLECNNNHRPELKKDITNLKRDSEGDLLRSNIDSMLWLEDFYNNNINNIPIVHLNNKKYIIDWIYSNMEFSEVSEDFYKNIIIDIEL